MVRGCRPGSITPTPRGGIGSSFIIACCIAFAIVGDMPTLGNSSTHTCWPGMGRGGDRRRSSQQLLLYEGGGEAAKKPRGRDMVWLDSLPS